MPKFALFLLALLLLSPPAQADEKGLAVLELFTTQGCPSCPPADYMLSQMVKNGEPNLIALSCHVTYFDRGGWRDTLSTKACDERQRGYFAAINLSGIKTPQVVINGRYDAIGNKEKLVRSAIALGQAADNVRPISLSIKGDMLNIALPGTRLQRPAEVWLMTYNKLERVEIKSGQNAGKNMNYMHTVTGIKKIMDWTGGLRNMAFPLAGLEGDGYAVIAQYPGPGAVITAGAVEHATAP